MLAGGRFIGILNLTAGQPDRPITRGQIKALHILAGAGASALDSSSLLEQLRDAERRYRRLSEDAPDVVFRYELYPERRCSYVNPAVTALTGYSPQEHYADPDLCFTIAYWEDRPLLERILRGAQPNGSAVTMRWTHKNGSVIWIEQRTVLEQDRSGRVVAIEGIARDITERKQLEEQLRHAQKMEAVGRLTAGVAHDFNNLLTVINGYADLTLRELVPGSPSRRKVDEVRKAGEQAAALTRQLLAIGRKQVTQPRVIDLNAVVKRNSNILRRVIGEDVEFVLALDPALGAVKADEGQIEQILLNLTVNSRDAMPKGGRLTIETRNGFLEDGSNSESRVVLAVADTGCGMDADTQSRVFEPFFTTKETGRGTGLGLSIVYGIVKQSGGALRLFSEPGKGTRLEIYLPRVEEQAAGAVAPHTPDELMAGSE
ncbi:MAG: two-component system sensor histidine kinase NtrB, partial [bacterium]